MSDAPMTISVLAGLETDASKSGLTDADRAKLAAKLREHAHEVVALKPYDVGPRLVELLTESLRKPVAGILGEVWKQRKELREAAAKGTGAKTVKADVELIEHSMTWTLKPSITVKVTAAPAPVPSVTLAVDVNVTLELHGVNLVIENARITTITAGTIKSKVDLAYKGIPLSAPFEKEIDLRGELVLPNGGIDLS